EPMPEVSLSLIKGFQLDKGAAIIDIGGGDSFLAEFLVSEGYTDITVVDISSKAIERAKERMCEKADSINWIVADASEFKPQKQYDLWHDRATFHFFTDAGEKENYLKTLKKAVKPGGYVILATFSE
ncbi:class I SAM-dependent methyltransferase, partial [Tamlana crocina]